MSLINDALKRASQSDRNRPPPVGAHAAMQPVVHRRSLTLLLVVGVCIVLALALAGLFFWQWWNAGHPPVPAKVEPGVVVAPKPAPPPVGEATQKTAGTQVARETPPAPVADAPIAVPVPKPEPAPSPPAKPVEEKWPAELKVMGIFFSKTNPRALINGKTIEVGDLIDGIRITKIESDRVTVEWKGHEKELLME
jgi:hypothetical protein